MTTEALATPLDVFRCVDFDWATRLQDIWRDAAHDVPELHARTRAALEDKLSEMRMAAQQGRTGSPLGWVLVGPGGSGKTHLLGALRRQAADQGAGFVLVDMTDVRDFWETVLQGYLNSLQAEYRDGQYQHAMLLGNVINHLGSKQEPGAVLQTLAHRKTARLAEDVKRVLGALHRRYPRQTSEYQDVVRALICLNSEDFGISSTGYTWLEGLELDEPMQRELGFQRRREQPLMIVKALSWLMSLSGPTVVAFDQLDPIVHQLGHHQLTGSQELTEEQGTARAIIEQIAGGLSAMRDVTCSTLSIVSCVESTWSLLTELVLHTHKDRFETPARLKLTDDAGLAQALIQNRLAPVYRQHEFTPPYPTWPFEPDAINALVGDTPREILKLCEAHRKKCIEAGTVTPWTGPSDGLTPPEVVSTAGLDAIDARFEALRGEVDPAQWLDERFEDERLAALLQTALQCLVHEHEERLPADVDAVVEIEFTGGKVTKPLHARLRLVFHRDHSREEHYCVRALQRSHHAAYKARLKAAMTQSGIDRALKFRHLTIVRHGASPGGEETRKLTQQFTDAGGQFYQPNEMALHALVALRQLQQENDPDFTAWLKQRRPVTRLGLHQVLAPGSLLVGAGANADGGADAGAVAAGGGPRSEHAKSGALTDAVPSAQTAVAPPTPAPPQPPHVDSAPSAEPLRVPEPSQLNPAPGSTASEPNEPQELPVGGRILGLDRVGETISLPAALLSRHTIILGGSGSGKSVTVRRIVEEAALLGIPSIIIDCAQDMAAFDQRWADAPSGWREGDSQRAERFHARTEMVVWTPGRESGNPLTLEPIPDLGPLASDPEELESAVQMLCGALLAIVAPGRAQSAANKEGILAASLRYFARHFPGGTLQDFIDLLSSLPSEAGSGIRQQQKLAEEMADSLRTERAKNPLLRTSGTPLDPAILFGDDTPQRDKTRLSVISLVGLKTDAAQQSFLNQLAMLLFSWIKKNPHPPGNRALRGLLVIDEAKDYVPSQKSTQCKESLMRLAAQARKYRLGLVFATQHPKDIETKIVGNCATHFYGLNNSPASLQTLQDLMSQKGGSGDDIPKLKAGQFYVHNADAGHQQPIKVQVPMSLSFSPSTPLDETQLLAKAQASRGRVGRR